MWRRSTPASVGRAQYSMRHPQFTIHYEMINTDAQHTHNWIELHVSCTNLWHYSIEFAEHIGRIALICRHWITETLENKFYCFFSSFLSMVFRFRATAINTTTAGAAAADVVERIYLFDVRFQMTRMKWNSTSSENYYFLFLCNSSFILLQLQSIDYAVVYWCRCGWPFHNTQVWTLACGGCDQFFIDKTNDEWINRCQFNNCDELHHRVVECIDSFISVLFGWGNYATLHQRRVNTLGALTHIWFRAS